MIDAIRLRMLAVLATAFLSMLTACGGGAGSGGEAPMSQATLSTITSAAPRAGVSPFISFIDLQGGGLEQLDAVRYVVAAAPGAVSRPVDVTYSIAALRRAGHVDAERVTVPVFGLYAGASNQVSMALVFKDSSKRDLTLSVSTAAYVDPNGIYDQPTFVRKRAAGSALGFDYFFLKSRLGSPVVMDTDGAIRWAVPNIATSTSAKFQNSRFVLGDPQSPRATLLELDGSSRSVTLSTSTLTNFHHNIDPGKLGLLGEFDAKIPSASTLNIESTIAEFDPDGTVLKLWDFAALIGDQMNTAGDDAAAFVRHGIDWFHSNASVYDPRDDSLIVSSRENFVVKVDYTTGRVIWILGDPTKYWHTFPSLRAKAVKLPDGDHYPIGQHAVSITSDGLLMLFDDGLGSLNQPAGAPAGETRGYSAVAAYSIDTKMLSGKEVWRFDYGRTLYSDICSSAYEGRGQSILVNYAVAQGRTQVRLVGLDAQRSVVFDIALKNTKNCDVSWNAEPLAFDALRID